MCDDEVPDVPTAAACPRVDTKDRITCEPAFVVALARDEDLPAGPIEGHVLECSAELAVCVQGPLAPEGHRDRAQRRCIGTPQLERAADEGELVDAIVGEP